MAVADPSRRGRWPRKGQQAPEPLITGQRARLQSRYLVPACLHSRGACDTSRAGGARGREAQAWAEAASERAGFRQQSSMGNVSRAPTPAHARARRGRWGRSTDRGGGWLAWKRQLQMPA